ncbi:hypothetical protein BURK1_01107 [Burkholderiales bacterium]|nr:hypothetical protein BURK1_01107 [Burkholderiales bacterium]
MDTIIAGRFDGFDAAESARERLEACGFPRSSIRVYVDLQRGRSLRRPVRVTVAVRVGDSARDDDAIHVLDATGASSVERMQGEWRDAGWPEIEATGMSRQVASPSHGPSAPADARS